MTELNQITDTVLMVRPARFGFNEETAASNAFQQKADTKSAVEIEEHAKVEFDRFVDVLRNVGVHVLVMSDTSEPHKPDAVFPNNWVSFHESGQIVLYPMFAQQRRLERRHDWLQQLRETYQFAQTESLVEYETESLFLEGTGALVLDRPNRIAYACLSNRAHPEVLAAFAQRMDYQVISFSAADQAGLPIYHTNVILAVGESFVLICWDTISNDLEKELLRSAFARTHKDVIALSFKQITAFAGNMLQVRSRSGTPILVMSHQAFQALNPDQLAQISTHTQIVHSPIPTIERLGGGSARCMMAEVFYPGMGSIL